MLQFITHRNDRYDEVAGAEAVLRGGCRWIQLRMKEADDKDIIAAGRAIRRLCDMYGATFILDDRVELVGATGADGVHLGKNDTPPDEARYALGRKAIIGSTANTFEDIDRAALLGADYIGLGPFRFTETKKRLSPILGAEGYSAIMSRCRKEGFALPVVAIGGITAEDIPALMETGISGIAVSGALLNAPDPTAETGKMMEIINRYKK